MPYLNRHDLSPEDINAMLEGISSDYRYKIRVNNGKAKITRGKFGDIIKNRRS
tara:strand:- start:244 stop:402 length:159 start_codon:yes stop_codon:yes gene_type:complete